MVPLDELFPKAVTADPWVLFHGTSSCYETAIDKRGLTSHSPVVTKAELRSIASVYEELIWGGSSLGGYFVLEAYALSADYGTSNTKPLFLGESAASTLLYASRDFSAGETVRATLKAICDLQLYLESADVRQAHRNQIEAELRDDPYSRYARARYGDLKWLSRRVAELRPILDRCEQLIASCTHGLIYAVRVNEDEISAIEDFHPGKGVRWRGPIGQSSIVGKAIIPLHIERDEQAVEAHAHGIVPAYYGALREWVEVIDGSYFRPRKSPVW